MITRLSILLFVLVLVLGCTRDDICPESTETTPLLIITFKDIASPTQAKTVNNLTVQPNDGTLTEVVNNVSTDSIAIPLRTATDSTEYLFIKDRGETTEVSDIYMFTYSRENIYINRACSFKTIYDNLNATKQDQDEEDWILNLLIINSTIEDEANAHITIFH